MFSDQIGVQVHHLNDRMTATQQGVMLHKLSTSSQTERIRVVLDCSGVSNFNRSTLTLVLSCLELAMKCNGDVRLAAVPPFAEEKLRRMGFTQLFELHASTADAVQSFYRRRYSLVGMAEQTATFVENFALVA